MYICKNIVYSKTMSLVTLREILRDTRQKKYAVPAFNFNGYEDAQGMINSALKMRSPIILMASMGAVKYIGLKQTAGMIRGMAEMVDIPVCLHLDHGTDMALLKEAVVAGFTSVMIDASKENFEKNIETTRKVVDYAGKFGCSVEAELGKIGGREEHIVADSAESALTDPAIVPEFVEKTNVDALAVAVGTAHGFYKSTPKLDFGRLEDIVGLTGCPLVLHGGTGVPEEDFKKCIRIGMSKINVGTEFKAAYAGAIRDAVGNYKKDELDPRTYLKHVKEICEKIADKKIKLFGADGKA